MAEHKQEDSTRSQLVSAAGQFTGFGFTWALSVLFFLLGGWWLDGKLGTAPLFTILGAFLGGAAGFYSLYRHIVVASREQNGDVDS